MKSTYALILLCAFSLHCGKGRGTEDAGDDGSRHTQSLACYEDLPALFQVSADSGYCSPTNSILIPFAGGDGSSSDPFRICAPAQLLAVGTEPAAGNYYKLERDIDLTGFTISPLNPVGAIQFDGANHVISNLTQSGTNVGLFLNVSPIIGIGEVRNLHLRNIDLAGTGNIGGIAANGASSGGYIHHISISGKITQSSNGNSGFVASMLNGATTRVENAFVTGTIELTATNTNSTGGIVGRMLSSAQMRDSDFYGTIIGPESNYLGGIVGQTATQTLVERVHSCVKIEGSAHIGGLIGRHQNGITILRDSWSEGIISAINIAGALVGSVNSAIIENSYSISAIRRRQGSGLFFGYTSGQSSSGTYSNIFEHQTLSAMDLITGEPLTLTSVGTLLTSAQMRDSASFAGWDFNTIWQMGGKYGYPILE